MKEESKQTKKTNPPMIASAKNYITKKKKTTKNGQTEPWDK